MANEQSQLDIILRLKDEFSNKLNSASNNANSFSSKLSSGFNSMANAGKIVAGVITGGAVALGAFGAKAGMASARISELELVLGAVAKANDVGIEKAQGTVDQLRNFNIAHKQALEITNLFMQAQLDLNDAVKLGNVAKDLAVIGAMDSSEATKVLIEAVSSQSNMALRQFGIIKNLDDIYDEYGETINKAGDDLTETEKKQAFLNVIFKQGENVAGTYDAAMESVSKRYRSLTGRVIPDFIAQVGKAFEPTLIVIIDKISEAIHRMSDWVENNGETFKRWGETLAEWFKKLMDFSGQALNHLKPVYLKLKEFFDEMENRKATIVGVITVLTLVFGAWAISVIAAITPIILIMTAVGVTAGLLYRIWTENWGGIQDKTQAVMRAVVGFYNEYLVPWWKEFKEGLNKAVKLWKENWDAIKVIFQGVWQVIYNVFKVAWALLSGSIKIGIDIFTGNWKKAWEDVKDTFEKVFKGIYNIGAGIFESIIGALAAMVNGAIDLLNELIAGINKLPGVDIGKMGKIKPSDLMSYMPTLATGTNFVPNDTLAMIHKGEAIIPARYNPYAGGTAGGGITININGEQHYYNDQSVDLLVEKIKGVLSREQEKAQWGLA